MSPADVRAVVDRIASLAHDPERAHDEEDRLYIAVLRAIAEGATTDGECQHSELAREALAAGDIDFTRWYA